MQNVTVYLKCNRNVELKNQKVYVKDLGSLRCADANVSAKLKALCVHHFRENGAKRCVISVLKVIEQMEEALPQINLSVENLGETDVLVEWIPECEKRGRKRWKSGSCGCELMAIKRFLQIALVCFVSFFGTAFTIMAYHNDVGVNEMFQKVYVQFMNRDPAPFNALQVWYSIGLFLGIIIFFNHVGGRRITKDPTPIEVAMRNYERDVDETLIETASREGMEEEVQM